MDGRSRWSRYWDVFLDVGLNLWVIWLVLAVVAIASVQALLH